MNLLLDNHTHPSMLSQSYSLYKNLALTWFLYLDYKKRKGILYVNCLD